MVLLNYEIVVNLNIFIFQTLRTLLQRIFLECITYSAKSVAMPLLGTGKHRFPEDLVLRIMKQEVEKFSSTYGRVKSLKEIKIVRYDKGVKGATVQKLPTSEFLITHDDMRQGCIKYFIFWDHNAIAPPASSC